MPRLLEAFRLEDVSTRKTVLKAGVIEQMSHLTALLFLVWGAASLFPGKLAAAKLPPQAVVASSESTMTASRQGAGAPQREFADSRPSGPYCGVSSLYVALGSIGIAVDPTSLISPVYIGSVNGSSAAELTAAAEDNGATATFCSHLSGHDLQNIRTPVLLHVRGRTGTRFEHWVAFLGFQEGSVKLFDPNDHGSSGSTRIRLVPMAEVLAIWDGNGVIVSRDGISTAFLWHTRTSLLLVAALIAVSLFAASVCAEILSHHVGHPALAANTAIQAVILLAASGIVASLHHAISPNGFMRNRAVLASIRSRFHSEDVPAITLSELRAKMAGNDVVLIDARRRVDFHAGSIPGAINVPVNSTVAERARLLSAVRRNDECVVYCQSERCNYAESVATFMVYNGYQKVYTFNGGYREWETRSDVCSERLLK